MIPLRLWWCTIGLIALGSFIGGCASAGGNASLNDWRHSVQKYVNDRGKGDPVILRDVTWPQSRRAFSTIGGDDPRISQDVRGVLLDFCQIGSKRWFIFIVGVVDKQVVDDIRVEAMNLQDNDEYTWRSSAENPKALATYRDYQSKLWKQRFPGRQEPPAQYTVFPQEADVFNVQVEGGRVMVTHPASGARWDLMVDATAGSGPPRHQQ